jgi:hypothetical protein
MQGRDRDAMHSATHVKTWDRRRRCRALARPLLYGRPMPPHSSSTDCSPTGTKATWHYAVRPLQSGEWAVERGNAEVGGTFANLAEAVRFLRFDLDTVVLTHQPLPHL